MPEGALNANYHQEWGGSVTDYMTSPVETLEADIELIQAAEHFLSSHWRFPVTSDGRLAGQISRADVLWIDGELAISAASFRWSRHRRRFCKKVRSGGGRWR
ncbi:CBS domain-containing protein [Mesorhizobium xinjiangense]|uniref:CBS domain-containing protein n=1 Tax=Mesorhizobium xinjiangense TaxID=2678685 RepID=UPI0018DD3AB0|nr:CBS domain-containing protein [Mesorhizobium xinjiangense]